MYVVVPYDWKEQEYIDTPVKWYTGAPETDLWEWYPHFYAACRRGELFEENMTQNEIAHFMFRSIVDHTDINSLLNNPAIIERSQRAILFARGDSAYLLGIFREAILKVWLMDCNLTWDELPSEKRQDLKFIIGGITAILGSPEYVHHPEKMISFPNSEIGSAVIRTLEQMQITEKQSVHHLYEDKMVR